MIDPKELRLGNIVFYPMKHDGPEKKGAYIKVYEINEEGDEYMMPVEITEGWLIKLGFTKTAANLNADPDDITYYDKQQGRHTLRFSYQFGSYLIQFEHDLCDFHVIGDENTVEFVHQVQNLFFSLTGEELTVNVG